MMNASHAIRRPKEPRSVTSAKLLHYHQQSIALGGLTPNDAVELPTFSQHRKCRNKHNLTEINTIKHAIYTPSVWQSQMDCRAEALAKAGSSSHPISVSSVPLWLIYLCSLGLWWSNSKRIRPNPTKTNHPQSERRAPPRLVCNISSSGEHRIHIFPSARPTRTLSYRSTFYGTAGFHNSHSPNALFRLFCPSYLRCLPVLTLQSSRPFVAANWMKLRSSA